MNGKSKNISLIEVELKEHMTISCPDDIPESVMNEVRMDYQKSINKYHLRIVITILGISVILMIGILYTLIQLPLLNGSGVITREMDFLGIMKILAKIWQYKFIPIFFVSFSVLVFIDSIIIKRKRVFF